MPIQVLPDQVVSRIAAGEVVERPASVVKEMVENAIDAGATDIKVECLEGGRRMIRITDNGHGIRADEAGLAFAHHATSKLSSADDLDHIATLGFRGEALASIASVSVVACATRHAEETAGTLLRIDGGQVLAHERLGRPAGTTMTVEHLFSRIPARLKFLKSNQTERGHIDGILTRYAMAYPHIRFALSHDGRATLQTSGNGSLRDVLIEEFGSQDVERMVAIEAGGAHEAGMQVSGFIGLPALSHASRNRISLFVNGRPVQDIRLASAVVQAYHTLLMVGRYPVAVVMLHVPPDDIDVNVHPAKAEVRFRDANAAFSAVQRAVRKTLLVHLPVTEAPASVFSPLPGAPAASGQQSASPAPGWPSGAGAPAPGQPALSGSEAWERVGIARSAVGPRPGAASPHELAHTPAAGPASRADGPHMPALRILGQLALAYVIAEGPEGLYLIDQHAAHERILFERMLAQAELGAVASQALLDPLPVELPAASAAVFDENLALMRELGFDIDHFGATTWLVRAVPALMVQDDIVAAVREIVADLELGQAPLRKDLEARVLRRVCKRMAIKAGRVLALAEMQALVRDLEACESPRTCPHGRPTLIQISTHQLEKQFGRLG